jgi:hypothetical protein
MEVLDAARQKTRQAQAIFERFNGADLIGLRQSH